MAANRVEDGDASTRAVTRCEDEFTEVRTSHPGDLRYCRLHTSWIHRLDLGR